MKKVIIIFLMFVISSCSYYGAVNEKGEKVIRIENSEQSENSEVSINENNINAVEESGEIAQEIQKELTSSEQYEVQQNTKIEQQTTLNMPNEVPKMINKEEKVEQKTLTKKEEIYSKQEEKQKEEIKQSEQIEEKVIEKQANAEDISKCNHNTQKFYTTKEEAIATYESEIKKWGEKWTSNQIDYEEYRKKCPIGYEVFSCPLCEKWTINMYYN